MAAFDWMFYLLVVSSLLVLIFFIYITKIRNKSQIQFVFQVNAALLFICCVSVVFELIFAKSGYGYMYFEYSTYIGACYIPVLWLFTGLIFAKTKIVMKRKHYLLFVVPTLSLIIIWTNNYHKLFYKKFSIVSSIEVVQGWYFYIHALYSYVCIFIGMYYLIYFSVKNSGFFSKQSLLIIIGTLFPVITNILYTMGVIPLSPSFTPISFTFAVACYALAILRFNFLRLSPIALQTVVDRISDSFIVLSEDYMVVDFNRTAIEMLSPLFKVARNESIVKVFGDNPRTGIDGESVISYIKASRESKLSTSFERHLSSDAFDKYFTIEITPIISNERFIGTILLLKDITQSKKNMEVIKEKQIMLMERERLASLGQLIGGIAHNLKTPIMSLAGGIEALKDLAGEYDSSIGDSSVTEADHHEIVREMKEWLNKMKPYCSYMSDVISTVKGQAVQMNDSSSISFTLDEVVKRMDLLMKHELKRYHCILNYDFQVDMNTELQGEVNNLVQIFDNIIINAIYAYEDREGVIDFCISKAGDSILFVFTDYAKGISPDVEEKLFKEMVTTKGKDGTGLGLYMSYSTIKGKFGGNMWIDTEIEKGTSVYISIPCYSSASSQEVS